MYDIKHLYEPKDIDEAVALREAHPDALIIGGGSDILIGLRDGKPSDCELISIYMLDELRGVSMDDDGTLRIGSLTSFRMLKNDPLISEHIPVLGEAADLVGGPQIRNIGTIGGNTCNGVTSADTASTLMAYDAIIEVRGKDGTRHIPIGDWYLKAKKVDLRPTEIQVAILIPKESYEGYSGYYFKYAMRNAMDIATCGCSVNVKLSEDKRVIEDARIAFGVAGPVPLRAPTAENAVRGQAILNETLEAFSEAVLPDIHPRTSWRASKEFRTHLMTELARRCLTESIKRSGGIFQ